jgi:hypothetical protein
MSSSLEMLKINTANFFDMHWNKKKILETPPTWSEPWFLTGSAPNFNKQGVYAFIKESEVTYIGSGASKGKKGYEGHGIGARLGSYIRVVEVGQYRAVDPKLQDAEYVLTIGFSQGFGHIAVALEHYLLARMQTRHNKYRPGS